MIKVMVPAPIKREPDRMKEVLKPYTRMTTWIDVLDDKTNIARWGKRLVLIGLAKVSESKRTALVAEILELAEQGDQVSKNKLNAIAERMHKVAGGDDKADYGTWLHDLSEFADRGQALPGKASAADREDMAAYKLATIDLEIKEIEHFVVLDEYKVGGTPDRMSWYGGLDPDGLVAGHLITDLKTGRTDYGGLKMAMQLSGYAHGKKYDPATGTRTPWPDDLNLRWGLIIAAPAGTGTAEVMWVDLTLGWRGFLLAKEVRAIRNEGRKAFRQYPSALPALAKEYASDEAEEGDE